MSTKPITIRVDEEEIKTLDRLTKARGLRSRSDAVRALVQDAARDLILEELRREVAESVANESEQAALREEFEKWEDLRAW